MADYDFHTLSSNDFQVLVRDLQQARLGLFFESFAPGYDRGIDARHKRIIIQAKHFAGSDASTLIRHLQREELPKIAKLKPSRYILATSLSLTVPAKEKLQAVLGPYCKSADDILGREDLNNLLAQHPDVERQHFKLWLTSTPVLERVLHAGIWNDTALTVERARERTARYVMNPSYDRAREILERYHYCIIAGLRGIGKTTLADILMVEYYDRHGYQVFRISDSIAESSRCETPTLSNFSISMTSWVRPHWTSLPVMKISASLNSWRMLHATRSGASC